MSCSKTRTYIRILAVYKETQKIRKQVKLINISRLVKEPNNPSKNVKLIEDHLNDKILLSSSCHRFTHLGYDPENTVSYFQIVKNALEYPY